jgi:hypothetical protein
MDHRWLKIVDVNGDSYTLTLYESLNHKQTYDTITGTAGIVRVEDGTGYIYRRWKKLKTSISGSGMVPAGLVTLDYNQPVTIYCATPRQYIGTLAPGAYRTDGEYAPFTIALPDKTIQLYYPIMQAWVTELPAETFSWDVGKNSSDWQMTAEEQ